MVLFVASEAMFFAAFFGGVLHHPGQPARLAASGYPAPEDRTSRRILTVILVAAASPFSCRCGRAITGGDGGLVVARRHVGLGDLFLALQLYDYSQLGFGLKDGVFGTCST